MQENISDNPLLEFLLWVHNIFKLDVEFVTLEHKNELP